MSTVIGLRSGREFVVKGEYYPFTHKTTGAVTTIFISEDRKRLITIPPSDSPIEFFDELVTEEFLKQLVEPNVVKKSEVTYNDPNVR